MKKVICILAMLVTACASPQERAEAGRLQSALNAARAKGAVVTCSGKESCDKAFSLTKIYVQSNSDMKIQTTDNTIVSTYNPYDYGYVGMYATMTPDVGNTSVIALKPVCKGENDPLFVAICARKLVPIYEGFKPFIEARLP